MTTSLIAIAILLVLVFARMPVAFAMALVGAGGFAMMRGPEATHAMVGSALFDTGLSYGLSVVPLFIFMGNILARSGIAHGLFAGANRLLGQMRGGLALATVLSCGGFSALSGSSLATAATLSRVAMPTMRHFGYDDRLATGAIAAGGTLGILIPPSVVLIILGLLTGADIGKLFLAGLLPGLLGLVLYLAAVMVTVRLNPALAPTANAPTPLSRRDVIGVLGGLALVLMIMIGIYAGVFTPVEAAGMGAALSVILALLIGGLTLSSFWAACHETVTASAMIFAIILGAEIFSTFITLAGLPDALVDIVYDMDVSPWLVVAVMVGVYLILGCVFESLSMILLTIPVFYPIVAQLDFGPGLLAQPDMVIIWFAIIVVVATEISLITPPVGLNVFVLRANLPDVSLSTIFWGVLPFWLADLLRLGLLIAMPWLSLALLG